MYYSLEVTCTTLVKRPSHFFCQWYRVPAISARSSGTQQKVQLRWRVKCRSAVLRTGEYRPTSSTALIHGGDESAYKREVEQLVVCCSYNKLDWNMLNTVELIVAIRKNTPALLP